jgi:hypothetical protein
MQGDAPEQVGLEEKPPDRDAATKAAQDQPDLAERFVESPAMEDLMVGATRSGMTEVFTPRRGDTVEAGTRFSWKTAAPPPFEVILVDNRERKVESWTTQRSYVVLKRDLPTGLYYWKLIGGGELLYVGKVVVR